MTLREICILIEGLPKCLDGGVIFAKAAMWVTKLIGLTLG